MNLFKIILVFTLALFVSNDIHTQPDKFSDDFYEGYYVDNEGNPHNGYIKVYVNQYARLFFKNHPDSARQIINVGEAASFTVNKVTYERIDRTEVTGAYGIKTKTPTCYAEVIEKGKFDMYHIYYEQAVGSQAELFHNLLLINENGRKYSMPLYQTLKKKRTEKIKKELIRFLNAEEETANQIEGLKEDSGFEPVIEIIRNLNR